MLRPLLIIGVGGSGGKTIRSMKQSLERKLLAANYRGGIPRAWQFLQLDTTRDGENFPAPMLDIDDFHQVVPPGWDFYEMRDSITQRGDLSDQQKMLAGWGIAYSDVNLQQGAGQTRAIGRMAGIADSLGIVKAISNSIAKMDDPLAYADLERVANELDLATPSKEPIAFIIASVAGGTGAGMFIDVAELLKRSTQKRFALSSISFLYTAEVFNVIGGGGKDTAKNSLGALNEIMAGKWVGLSTRSEFLYQKLGLPATAEGTIGRFGPKGNILIGAKNKEGTDISKGPDGQGMNEVFLTIGEALAGVVTDDKVSEWVYQQALVNIGDTSSALDISGLAPASEKYKTLAAAGIGFGQLSLGADRLVDYVADAMSLKHIKNLLFPDFHPHLLVNGDTNQKIIQNKVAELWPDFLLDSGLDERKAQDQIITPLFPNGHEEKSRAFARQVSRTSVGEKQIPLQRYMKTVYAEWISNLDAFEKGLRTDIQDNAKSWVPEIQDKLMDQVALYISVHGYSVTNYLLENLKKELLEHSRPDLLRESKEATGQAFRGSEQQFITEATTYAAGMTGVSSSSQNAEFLKKVEALFARSIVYTTRAYVREVAASLIQDLCNNLLDPVMRSLREARGELDKQIANNVEELGFPEWGKGEQVHARYRPRSIERILIDTAEYESTYEMYARRDSGGASPFDQSVSKSILGQVMNPKDKKANKQNLIKPTTEWVTGVREANPMGGALASKAKWEIKTSLEELGKRNREWLRDLDGSFGKFTVSSIQKFLADDTIDKEILDKREDKFVQEFQGMLALAEPLVLLNQNVMQYVKSVATGKPADGVLRESSPLPFESNSPIGVRCTNVLRNMGADVQDPSFVQKWFRPRSTATSIFAVSTTEGSLPAWAFASLTDPIVDQEAKSKIQANTWRQFWEGRRARPLVEAIPFESEIRRSIVTGWYLARLFGLDKISSNADGRTVSVWNPTLQTPNWSNFPDPLLDMHPADANETGWMLPAILTSAGLALAKFGKTGEVKNIEAYKLLLYMGREITAHQSMRNRDQWSLPGSGDLLPTGERKMSTFLRDWVLKGENLSELPLNEMLSSYLTQNSDRGEAMKATVADLRAQYSEIWEQLKFTPWNDVPETWELKQDIDEAFDDIHKYVTGLSVITKRPGA
jgi:hypothetical protein